MSVKRFRAHGRAYSLTFDADSHLGRRIEETGRPFEYQLLEHIFSLKLRGTAVDVGANIGNHSLWLAMVCRLRVVAFEPCTLDELRANVEANGASVRIEPVALGETEGVAADRGVRAGTLGAEPLDYETWGFNHLLKLGEGSIPVHTLDSYELEDVAVIKVDVEGLEAVVLAGGTDTIARCHPRIFAEALSARHHAGLARVLTPLGYERVARYGHGTPLEEWAWQG